MNGIFLFMGLLLVATLVFYFTKKENISLSAADSLAKNLKGFNNPLARKICMRLSVSKDNKTFVSYRFMAALASFEFKIKNVSLKNDLSKSERKEIEDTVNDVDTLVFVGALYYRYLLNCVRANHMPYILATAISISQELFYKECKMLAKVDYSEDAEVAAKVLFEMEGMLTWDRYNLLMNDFVLIRKDFKLNKLQYRLLEKDIEDYIYSWLLIYQTEQMDFLKFFAKKLEKLDY